MRAGVAQQHSERGLRSEVQARQDLNLPGGLRRTSMMTPSWTASPRDRWVFFVPSGSVWGGGEGAGTAGWEHMRSTWLPARILIWPAAFRTVGTRTRGPGVKLSPRGARARVRGPTDLYNLVDDPRCMVAAIQQLRAARHTLELAVLGSTAGKTCTARGPSLAPGSTGRGVTSRLPTPGAPISSGSRPCPHAVTEVGLGESV